MDTDDRLAVRDVSVVWRGADHVLISKGLDPGDRVVTTTLATYAPGMALRTREPDRSGGAAGAKQVKK